MRYNTLQGHDTARLGAGRPRGARQQARCAGGQALGAQVGARGARRRGRHGHAGAERVRAGAAGGSRRAAWARGLALGCALGALSLFLARFDSIFFRSHKMNTVHCKINFGKKIKNLIKIK